MSERENHLYQQADAAIGKALQSIDPATAVLGAIALHLRELASAIGVSSGECDTVLGHMEELARCAADDGGNGSAENLRLMREVRS